MLSKRSLEVLTLIAAASLGAVLPYVSDRLMDRITINDLVDLDEDEEEEEVPSPLAEHEARSYQPPQNMSEHEEATYVDTNQPNRLPIQLHYIHLGDLSVACPGCDVQADRVGCGLGTMEDRQSGEGDVNSLATLGVFVYPCGHTYFSQCFTDKVAKILNAEEMGQLEPGMFQNLVHCEEHGGEDGNSN